MLGTNYKSLNRPWLYSVQGNSLIFRAGGGAFKKYEQTHEEEMNALDAEVSAIVDEVGKPTFESA